MGCCVRYASVTAAPTEPLNRANPTIGGPSVTQPAAPHPHAGVRPARSPSSGACWSPCPPPRRPRPSRKLSKEIDVTVGPAGQRKVCTVVFDLYRPSTATRTHRKPAILTTNGFGGSKDDQADLGRAFARRGYVVLSYSGLGFGGSDCKITLDDPDWDGLAAKQLVTYLGGGKRANDGTKIRYVRRDRVSHDGREPPARPAGRHGRRVLRRPGAVRGRRHRPPGRHDRADHHLERPVLLAGAQQHRLRARRHLPDARHREGRLDQPLLRGRHRRRHRARPDRPDPQRRLPELRRPGLRGQGADGCARLPDAGHPGPRPARQRDVVPLEGPHPDAARAGPERHAVQPAGGGGDLPRRCARRARR